MTNGYRSFAVQKLNLLTPLVILGKISKIRYADFKISRDELR